MTKRVKQRKEDPSINFRLPQELKTKVLKEAEFHNKKLSNYLRDHLESFLSGKLIEEAIAPYKKNEFINSDEFLQLIVWMYRKREYRKYTPVDRMNQDKFIKTLKSINKHLPSEITEEFDKVLLDVMQMKIKNDEYERYNFCRTSTLNGDVFNYEKLEDFIAHLGIDRHFVTIER